MNKSIPRDWCIHGVFSQTPLIGGVLQRDCINYLAGKAGNDRDAVIAELAVAAATDAVECGLGPADKNGARASLSGFFGHPGGAAGGVGVVTSKEKADSLSRAVQANALARGVSKRIPVAVLGTHHVTGSHSRLNELAAWFEAEHGVSLGLLIIDAELSYGELLVFPRQGRAVLAVCAEAPADADGVVLEVANGVLTVAQPTQGAPWARGFDLEAVAISDAESLVLKPGKAIEAAPIWKAKPIAAIAPAAPPAEIPITSKAVVFFERGEVPAAERARWIGEGYIIARGQDDAIPAPGSRGRREIVVVGVGDIGREDIMSFANQIEQSAIRRGVSNDVLIRIAA